MSGGRNILAKPEKQDILDKLSIPQFIDPTYQPFGDGHAAEKIAETIKKVFLK